MVREGRTMGCFYIESPAMRQLLKRLRTQTFLGLTAASSVIRPGVAESGMMQEYIRRVRGAEPQLPSHPLMLKLLPETRGVMIYQEDVIKVGHELAGLSRAEADLLRRAMSGKLRSMERMNEVRERFVTGCEGNGIDTQSALTIWRQVASFGGYSFCKAHSASFASLSYKVAYLKAHYPAEYMAAVLSHSGGFYGQRAYLSECERLGLRVLPPDVNYSGLDYEAEGPAAIRVSLGEIKGVRREVLGRIVDKRGRGGRYTSLGGFIRHVRPPEADLGVLIQCGALDSLGLSRPEMQWLADGEYKAALNGGGLPLDETHCLADFRSRVGAKLRDHDELAKLDLELTHFGMLISRHPLTLIGTPPPGVIKACELSRHVGRQVRLLGWCVTTKRVGIRQRREVKDTLALQAANLDAPAALNGAAGDDEERDNPAAELGIIRKGEGPRAPYQHHRDRRAMKFMSMEDLSGTFEAVLFPRAYEQFAPITGYAGPYLVSGVVEEQFDTYTVDVRSLKLLPLPVGE
jgi:DNA polymerase III alpha subunit